MENTEKEKQNKQNKRRVRQFGPPMRVPVQRLRSGQLDRIQLNFSDWEGTPVLLSNHGESEGTD